MTLDAGPALEMRAADTLTLHLRVRRVGSKGTGLAQPMKKPPNSRPMMGNSTVPMGSRWGSGLMVIRPMRAAVSSSRR